MPYYYAGGKKVPLHYAEDLFVIDTTRPSDAKAQQVIDEVLKDAQSIRQGIHVVTRSKVDEESFDYLHKAGLAQPVYQADGATIIALPEVRVEESRSTQKSKLRSWADRNAQKVQVTDDGERVTIVPLSGTGEDALKIANEITEVVKPEMAQARFLRIVPRPR